MKKIAEACFHVALVIENAMPELKNKTMDFIDETVLPTPLGNIIIGSMGDDIYDGDMPLILIEPGGDDTYSFKNHSVFSVIVDISGDDTYESSNNSFLASGIMGLGFLIDVEGDDLYQGENFSFGCGFMGAGVLSDLKGDDSYISQAFSQGAAALGIGLLHDENGNDFYQCSFFSISMSFFCACQ